jgi:predicted metal-dependent hydrolase
MKSSTIIAFISDLMFQTRVESIANKRDIRIHWIESEDQLGSPYRNELAALGKEWILLDELSRISPNLFIFDLNNSMIPWRVWIPVLKSVPPTRRIPLICFGSHVDVDSIRQARRAGADEVLARSRFVSILPELIEKYIQPIDFEFLSETCLEDLHPEAIKGIQLFNKGDYFSAHEMFENAWMDDQTTGRDLYRGLLQVSVAYYQVKSGNFKGTIKMFQRCRQWLNPLPDICRGVDIAQFRKNAYAAHDRVLDLGSRKFDEFPIDVINPIKWNSNQTG